MTIFEKYNVPIIIDLSSPPAELVDSYEVFMWADRWYYKGIKCFRLPYDTEVNKSIFINEIKNEFGNFVIYWEAGELLIYAVTFLNKRILLFVNQ